MSETNAAIIAVLLTICLLLSEHYTQKNLLRRPLPRWFAYTIGSLAILAGFAVWQGLMGDFAPVARLGSLFVLGGGTVVLMYLLESARDGQGQQERADYLDRKHTKAGEDETA